MEVKNDIILALDVPDLKTSQEIVNDIRDQINTIKVGYPLVLSEGLKCISFLKQEFEVNIIADFKVADIPETNKKIADLTFQEGADALIIHGFVGEDSAQACLKSAKNFGGTIFLLTEMSHPGAAQFIQPVSLEVAQMGVKLGIENYVGPSTRLDRLEKIREIIGDNSFLISPGVGTQGGDPQNTLNYADALIVGRSIYLSNNPQEAFEAIINSIKV